MDKDVQKAVNDQVRAEFYAAYLYLSMAAYFEGMGYLPGAASWMKMQAQEETTHAMKFYDFLQQNGGVVELQAIDQPPHDFGSVTSAFEAALEHEKKVTGMIHSLYELALEKKDYAFQSFLKWFIDEQVEEEQQVIDILAKFELIDFESKQGKQGLLFIDNELGQRTNAPDSGE